MFLPPTPSVFRKCFRRLLKKIRNPVRTDMILKNYTYFQLLILVTYYLVFKKGVFKNSKLNK